MWAAPLLLGCVDGWNRAIQVAIQNANLTATLAQLISNLQSVWCIRRIALARDLHCRDALGALP
jgi:hypothetical protein